MFTRDHLESLNRKQLQTLAKEHGLKANGASEKLIVGLLSIAENTASEDQEPVMFEPVSEPMEETAVEPSQESEVVYSLEKGGQAFACVNDEWVVVTIKKVNKKSFRVILDGGKEVTVENDLVSTEKPAVADQDDELALEESMEVESEPAATTKDGDVASKTNHVPVLDIPVSESSEDAAPQQESEEKPQTPRWSMTKAQILRNAAIRESIASASKPSPRPPSFASTSCRTVVTPSRRKMYGGAERASFIQSFNNTPCRGSESETGLIASQENNHTLKVTTISTPAAESKKTTTSAIKAAKSPNFAKIHAKQFQNSKSIASMVEKDSSVEVKMTKALENAKKNGYQQSQSRVQGKIVSAARSNTTSIKAKDGVYGKNTFGSGSIEQKSIHATANAKILPSTAISNKTSRHVGPTSSSTTFKARPMPNFKTAHSKMPVHNTSKHAPGSGSCNKENTANSTTSTASATDRSPVKSVSSKVHKPTVSSTKRASTVTLSESNRGKRQSMFVNANKDRRASSMMQSRARFKVF